MTMRTMSREDYVSEFHNAMGQAVNSVWTLSLLELRNTLLMEEITEVFLEFDTIKRGLEDGKKPTREQKAKLLKELADLQYVLSGAAVALGLPLQEAFNRVHKSNMSKLGDDGKPYYREDGKVIKGPNYNPPVLDDLV